MTSALHISKIKVNRIEYVADYFPYGKILRSFSESDEERFLTTQHERDAETGLDYRGARYYDSDVARFLSLDPHAVSYPSLSDYCYVAGNPIIYIDPDGKDVGIYVIDMQGNVTHKKTVLSEDIEEGRDDNYDMVYLESDWIGHDWGNGKRLDDQNILKDLSSGTYRLSSTTSGSDDEKYKLFKFFADNTNVEWTVFEGEINGEQKTVLATSHQLSAAVSPHVFGIDKGGLKYMVHSHPQAHLDDEVESMGGVSNGLLSGDRSISRATYKYNNEKAFKFQVYMRNTKHLYEINPAGNTTPKLIKRVGTYKDIQNQ